MDNVSSLLFFFPVNLRMMQLGLGNCCKRKELWVSIIITELSHTGGNVKETEYVTVFV